MAYLRRRSGGRFSLLIYWKGKKHQKGLCTTDSTDAAQIKLDVEEQLRRIRNGEASKATQLLDEGFSIVDVLFGCPEIDKRLTSDPEANPLTLRELSDAYLEYQLPTVGPDERYNSTARFKKLCEFFGDDRRVMTITESALTAYHVHRRDEGLNGTSVRKEFGSLKAAITWAVRNKRLPVSPISDWPQIKVRRLKRFEWKSDIDRMIAAQSFESDDERRAYLKEMSARMVLTASDMRDLIDLARREQPVLVVPLMSVCATGMRRKEMVQLRKEDFDPQRGTLMISSRKQSRTEDVTTRTVVLPRHVADAVKDHFERLPARERMLFPVFSQIDRSYNNRWVEYEFDAQGQPRLGRDHRKVVKRNGRGDPVLRRRTTPGERGITERARRLLNQLIRETEFELMGGWHCLRHSFISILVAQGKTWDQIAAFVGHLDQRTTQRYIHFMPKDKRDTANSIPFEF